MKPPQLSSVVLSSERLKLRLVEERDARALFSLYSDRDVMRYWNHEAWTTLAQAEIAINEARSEYSNGDSIHYVIEQLSSQTVVGSCALYSFVRNENCASLGYLLSRSQWGKGYLTEAMEKFLSHAFLGLKLERVCAQINPDNTASARLLDKLGFLRQGCKGENWIVAGKTCQTHSYIMHRRRWLGIFVPHAEYEHCSN